ncbi:helix-turn-helix transcriptional regulator [Lachnoclostridium sp. An169]|uniref:helix-turn-helix transcriptional regulator n=1 Tax=Lachnoclostridium sp. An169 TaxID=1965569 RepID=UPI0013A6674F|nr:helix-turn-helix transcriptional regulator [Lachnoclostridium sp. An169]
MNYIFENYQNITLRRIARHFGYSEPYLCSFFQEETHSTFSKIIRDFRIKQAEKLLQTTDLKLNEICDSIDYSDVTHFIRDFKKQYGSTPIKYRKQFS